MITETIDATAQSAEQARVSEIKAIANVAAKWVGAREASESCDNAIRNGMEVNAYRTLIYGSIPRQTPIVNFDPNIGMNDRETSRYSLGKAIKEAAEGRLSGIELEASDEARRRDRSVDHRIGSFTIPQDVLNRGGWLQRDSLVATNTLGGFLVGSQLQASSFIDALRARVVAMRLGAQTLSGLVGNVVIPRLNTSATISWVGEVVSSTEGNIHLGQVTLSPKCPSCFVDFSKQLLVQSTPDIESIIRSDLVSQIAGAIDYSVFQSLGGTAPVGLQTMTGVNAVTIGDNGGAITWAKVLEMEQVVASGNGDISSQAYVTNPKVRNKMKQTLKNTTGTDAGFIWDTETPGSPLNGYRCEITNNVTSAGTTGTSTTVCSSLYFGSFDQVLIGFWSGVDLLVDRTSAAATRVIRIYADQYLDIAARQPAAFARITDITT
ncbi:MAG TPA: phage major capsid protein [Verrucomicrobiae bacterium]